MTDGRFTIGFIGLGNMGRPMTTRLAGAGHRLLLLDLDRTLTEALATELGQQAAGSLAALGAGCDVVITMLPDGRTVQRVLLGEAGDGVGAVAGSLKKGATVIDMSSSSPVGTRELGERLAKMDIRFIDAPVSGAVRWTARWRSWWAATLLRSRRCARCSRRWASHWSPAASAPATRSRR